MLLFVLQLLATAGLILYTQRLDWSIGLAPRLGLVSGLSHPSSHPSRSQREPAPAVAGVGSEASSVVRSPQAVKNKILPGSLDELAGSVSLNSLAPLPSCSVIIPAYNEAENLQDCVRAALAACPEGAGEVWVVDDASSDRTLELAYQLQAQLQDPRLHVMAGGPRPQGETWVGKNWACAQVVPQTTGEYLLFVDADVRLSAGAIAPAVALAEDERIDLLTLCPTLECGCLAEWLVQPLIMGMFACGFPPHRVSDPDCETTFAVGPFMLFRRSAYEAIDGHRGVADQVVEDVQLAGRIQQAGLKLYYALGPELARVRMYRNAAQLWEGWTKNWYLGSGRNLPFTLIMALLLLLYCTLPYVTLCSAVIRALLAGLPGLGDFWSGDFWSGAFWSGAFWSGDLSSWNRLFWDLLSWKLWPGDLWQTLALVLASISVFYHYRFRRGVQQLCHCPGRYWWLTGLSGIAIAAIALGSVIKTETGWGWTWRGRSLQ